MDSSEQDEFSFGEVDVTETEELAENDPVEPEGNMNNTEQGVRFTGYSVTSLREVTLWWGLTYSVCWLLKVLV